MLLRRGLLLRSGPVLAWLLLRSRLLRPVLAWLLGSLWVVPRMLGGRLLLR